MPIFNFQFCSQAAKDRPAPASLRCAGQSAGGPMDLAPHAFLALAFVALWYALWTCFQDRVCLWTARELCVLPRFSAFWLAAHVALLVQSARPSRRLLSITGWSLAGLSLWLLAFVPAQSWPGALVPKVAEPPAFQLLRLEAALLAAVALGTALGRGLREGPTFVTLIFCAAAGDLWLRTFQVAESAQRTEVLSLLLLPWPDFLSQLGPAPAWTDVVLVSAFLEGARGLGCPSRGALWSACAGYASGAFLALSPAPEWPAMAMAMCGSGLLLGCWPELKCRRRDFAHASLVGAALLALLLAITLLHRKLHPEPSRPMAPPSKDLVMNDNAQN